VGATDGVGERSGGCGGDPLAPHDKVDASATKRASVEIFPAVTMVFVFYTRTDAAAHRATAIAIGPK
jgi:hypothetical protein